MQPKLEPVGARQELVGGHPEDWRDTQKDQAQRVYKGCEFQHPDIQKEAATAKKVRA